MKRNILLLFILVVFFFLQEKFSNFSKEIEAISSLINIEKKTVEVHIDLNNDLLIF